jgi:hypothetical protein
MIEKMDQELVTFINYSKTTAGWRLYDTLASQTAQPNRCTNSKDTCKITPFGRKKASPSITKANNININTMTIILHEINQHFPRLAAWVNIF